MLLTVYSLHFTQYMWHEEYTNKLSIAKHQNVCVGEQKQNMSINAVSKLLPVVQLRENDTETRMKTSLSMCLRIIVSVFFYRKLAF